MGGKMYMIGGSTGEAEASSTSTMEVYDPTKDVWTQGPNMPIAVTAACAVSHKDVIIVSGGFNSTGESSEVFMFNVTTSRWCWAGCKRGTRAQRCSSTRTRSGGKQSSVSPRVWLV